MVVDMALVSGATWKDKLLGGKGSRSLVSFMNLSETFDETSILKMDTSLDPLLMKPSKPFRLMDVENEYYLVRFQDKDDYEMVLAEGPWVVFGHYLTVQRWTVDFNPFRPFPSKITISSQRVASDSAVNGFALPKTGEAFDPWMGLVRSAALGGLDAAPEQAEGQQHLGWAGQKAAGLEEKRDLVFGQNDAGLEQEQDLIVNLKWWVWSRPKLLEQAR
ncbi:hypothetical protein PVK06_004743 [Gossypium arboreum]|uniref:DUF4283 domain-containing protein n=1 Tax=Gossypium arboreum TaxID=29729 RepID=A0ABR0QU25_GOSAR|nr:hypothetical protein PVK06_004743 [Gossypium arboreum]